MVFYGMFASGGIEAVFAAEDFVAEVSTGTVSAVIVFTGSGLAGSAAIVVGLEAVNFTVLVATTDVSGTSKTPFVLFILPNAALQ